MGKRRNRARRDDPREMTREQFVAHCVARYERAYRRAVREYVKHAATSPYMAIERLRYP